MNAATESKSASRLSLAQTSRRLLRHYLRSRMVLALLALAIVGAGLALNWSWLVAAAIAPILLALTVRRYVRAAKRAVMAVSAVERRFTMKRLNQVAFVLAISGAAAALPSAAQQRELPRQPPSEPMPGMMQGQGMMGMMGRGGDAAGRERPQLTLALQHRAELGLDDAQGKTLEALTARFRSAAEKRMGELDAAEAELAALLKQDAAAGSRVEAKVRAIERLRADLRLERIRTIAEGRAALSAEQRAKLDQLAAEPARGATGMMGRGGGMRGMEGMDHK